MEKINIIPESTVRTFGVQSLADRPNIAATYGEGGLSAAQLKARFDSLCQEIIKKINSLIDILGSEAAADYVGVNLADFSSLGDVLAAVENGTLASILQAKLPGGTELDSLQRILNSLLSEDAELGELIEEVKREILERVVALESRDEIVLTVGNKPKGYAEDETVWSTIGNRPNVYGRYRTIWNALMSEAQSVRTGLDAVYSEAEDTTSKVGLLDRRVTNLEAVNRGVSYLEESVSSVAYEAPIPTHAAPFAHLDRVGGATTRNFNSILDLSPIKSQTIGNVTLTCEAENGIITLNGRTESGAGFQLYPLLPSVGEKTILIENVGGTVTGYSAYDAIHINNAHIMGMATFYFSQKSVEAKWTYDSTDQNWNEIGELLIYASPGTTFNNYRLFIGIGNADTAWTMTENKPTALVARNRNLLPFPYESETGTIHRGITFDVNDDGSITANGTATGAARFTICNNTPIAAGTYTVSGCKGGTSKTYRIAFAIKSGGATKWSSVVDGATTFTLTTDALLTVQIALELDEEPNNLVFNPQLERGNTATAYTKPSATISTAKIPDISTIAGVKGWGQGVPSVGGNYIEFTDDGRVLYHRTTDRVELTGDENWRAYTNEGGFKRFYCPLPSIPLQMNSGEQPKAVCSHYDVVYDALYVDDRNCVSMAIDSSGNGSACFYDTNFYLANVREWQDYVAQRNTEGNPIVIEYALATLPDPIDITDRFVWDGFIEGQGNGSVIVENTAKADLPTTLTYMVSTRGE